MDNNKTEFKRIPSSAASRNLDVAVVTTILTIACVCLDWSTAALVLGCVAAFMFIGAVSCFLDVQEMNMHLLASILDKLSRKDKDNDAE